jgi:polyisoprenoid-binding protein YceI
MSVPDGTYRLSPRAGRLLVKTARTGLGAKAGHDLTIEVTRWQAEAVVNAAGPAASSVSLTAEVDSFEVREGTGGVKPLTDADRRDIAATLRDKILHAGRHPTITFISTRVSGTPEALRVEGDLAIAGTTQPVTVQARLMGGRAVGSASVVQSRWGIKPYSAFLGALKLRDEVVVEFDLDMTPARLPRRGLRCPGTGGHGHRPRRHGPAGRPGRRTRGRRRRVRVPHGRTHRT